MVSLAAGFDNSLAILVSSSVRSMRLRAKRVQNHLHEPVTFAHAERFYPALKSEMVSCPRKPGSTRARLASIPVRASDERICRVPVKSSGKFNSLHGGDELVLPTGMVMSVSIRAGRNPPR